MSSAVQNLQKAIVDGQLSLTQLLRQTKLIAAKLNLKDVEAWVDSELNGYADGKTRPAYREVTSNKLMLRNPYRGWEHVGDVQDRFLAHHPITEIEILAQKEDVTYTPEKNYGITDNLGTSMGSKWPQRVSVDPGQFKRILEAVRNELLNWAIELEKRGIKGEDMSFDEQEKKAATNLTFNNCTVHGMAGNISHSVVNVSTDFRSVQTALFNADIPKAEKRQFEDLLEEIHTAPPEKKKGLIANAERLLVKHKDSLGVGAEIVGRFLKATGVIPSPHTPPGHHAA